MFNTAQRIVLVVTRMVSGSLSVLASSIIIYKVYLRYQVSRRASPSSTTTTTPSASAPTNALEVTTYHRMLLGMAALDILFSFWAALGTIPVPASTGAVFGFGTTMTCATQGYFMQFATAIPIYTATLNTYFMLKIRYNIPDKVLQTRYEPWLHAIPFGVAVTTATIGASLRLFNPIGVPEMTCWISPYPYGCQVTGNCTRGYKIAEHLDLYVWALCYMWLLASFTVVIINSVLIYTAIRHQERRPLGWNMKHKTRFGQSFLFRSSARTSAVTASSNSNRDSRVSGIDATFPPRPATSMDDETTDIWKRHESSTNNGSGRMDDESSTSTNPTPHPATQHDSENSESDGEEAVTTVRTSTPQDSDDTARALSQARKAKGSRIAATQSFLYCSATFLTAVWIVMPWIGIKSGVNENVFFFLALMANSVAPLHGTANLILYNRALYQRLRKTQRDWSPWQCCKACLFSPDTR